MSTDPSIEQCSICMENFTNQEIGIPDHCEHSFCFQCLLTWAKNNNTCPNDRQIFQYILKKQSLSSSKPYSKINIHDQSEVYLEDHFTSCYACGSDDQEYPLVICERCSDSYHTFCLNSFDTSAWICPSCGYDHDKTKKLVNTPVILSGLRDQGRPPRCLQQGLFQSGIRRIRFFNPITRNSPRTKTISLGAMIRTSDLLIDDSNAIRFEKKPPPTRSVITPSEAARRIAVSGVPVLPRPQTAPLINQVQNRKIVHRKRTRVVRHPTRIPIHELPRIQRRADAPPRSKPKTQKSNPTSSLFIDKLLNSQKQLYSLQNIRMQGPHIEIS